MIVASDSLSHVVVVTDSLDIDGGSGKVALTSARALANRGFETTVFAATGTTESDTANLHFVSTEQGLVLGDDNVVAAAARGLYNFSARKELRALLAEHDPARTVVHVHGWTKALSASIFDAIFASGIPVVVTLHEYFMACPTGSLYLHREDEICRLRPMGAACVTTNCDSRSYAHKAYRVARQIVQRDLVRIPARLGHLLTVSNFSREILRTLLPGNQRIDVLRNPIDIQREPRVIAEGNRAYVYVGRLSAEKGAGLFAEAARKAGVAAVFIGDGEERAKIARVNPDARIVGWVRPADVFDHLRGSRTVVLPSLWYETFGLVVLEGAALGIPSIVPAGTAPSDLVKDGVTGTLFERGDVDDLAAALRAHERDEVTMNLSRNAYETYWADPATIDNHVTGLLTAYGRAREDFFVARSSRAH